jgi:hypothetical protein
VIYNKKRYGIVADRDLIVLSEKREKLAYTRSEEGNFWQQTAMTERLSERSKDAVSILRIAEELLVKGRYTTAKAPT